VSDSLSFNQKLVIKQGNLSITVPVGITYRRLSDNECAKIEQDRLAAEMARRKEMERKMAEAKSAAEAPIKGEQRQQLIVVLRSSDGPDLVAALKQLSGKTPRSDDELARAIRPHLNHSEASVQNLAKKALAAFSPDYKRQHDLTAQYRGSQPVSELGLWVSYDTPLPAGLIVAANMYGHGESRYYPATVQAILSNGLVKVKHHGRGGRGAERLREDIFLAPQEVEQPNLDNYQLEQIRAHCEDVRQSLGASPETIKRLQQLNRAYRDTRVPLPKTGSPIPDNVKLPKFLVVAARKKDGNWYQAHVQGELPDGRVAVRFSEDAWDAKLPRTSLRLPPPEVKPINLPPLVPGSRAPVFRTWTDDSGTFQVRAKFLGKDGTSVRLVTEEGGKELTVQLNRLSKADRDYVESLHTPAVTNPFVQ